MAVIAAKPDGFWTLAYDYISGNRLLRIRVVPVDASGNAVDVSWRRAAGARVSADGLPFSQPKTGMLLATALCGALVGKLGGSSADLPDPSSASSPYGTKKAFAVGSYCVISVSAAEGGPLFLTMNDNPESFADHSGSLHVAIDEYPT